MICSSIGVKPNTHRPPDCKIHGANMGPTWVLSVPGGPHFGPMNLAAIYVSSVLLHAQFERVEIRFIKEVQCI